MRDQLRRFLHGSETAARAAGLTPAQHQLLLAVRGHSTTELPTISDIAEHLQLRHHSAVELIDRAENAGLVERIADATDHRVVRVGLREAARVALDDLTAYHVVELRVLAATFAAFDVPQPSSTSDVAGGA